MYSHCLFCVRPLGSNESIEFFPGGRRLAFDVDRGRLWVVCPRCRRWNLSPLDERWEAIESCDRHFAATRRRVSTDNIGLARLAGGLDLIRIGNPQRNEFAAWRYGNEILRRRRHTLIVTAAVGAAAVGGIAATAGLLAFGAFDAFFWGRLIDGGRTVARIPTSDGKILVVRRRHLGDTWMCPANDAQGWSLTVAHTKGSTRLTSDEALRVAWQLFPALNRIGGSERAVQRAVAEIEDAGSPTAFLKGVSAGTHSGAGSMQHMNDAHGSLSSLPREIRLAVEMATHEEAERRALLGELAVLEEAWREAERIASIADNLLVPDSAQEFIERHRRQSSS